MSNKIGLITYYRDNFGSILQCYSTKRILEKMGYECFVLTEPDKAPRKVPKLFRYLKRCLVFLKNIFIDPGFLKRWFDTRGESVPLAPESQLLMKEFVDTEISPMYVNFDEFNKIEKGFFAFVVGSDQMWNATNKLPDYYFLKFTSRKKRIAFAVSLGVENPDARFIERIEDGVKGFDHISVREESGKCVLERLTDVHIKRIADPTLMLSKEDWKKFYGSESVNENLYVLVHFLNKPSKLAIEYIEKNKGKCKVICIAYKYDIFKNLDWKYVDCNPKEYVAYIDNAQKIFTDSFHTTMFSINLGKQFFTFEREYLHSYPQTGRIKDLLKRYCLEDHFIQNINQDIKTDNVDLDIKLEEERLNAETYLEDALKRIGRL